MQALTLYTAFNHLSTDFRLFEAGLTAPSRLFEVVVEVFFLVVKGHSDNGNQFDQNWKHNHALL